jgi:hypothetical protein
MPTFLLYDGLARTILIIMQFVNPLPIGLHILAITVRYNLKVSYCSYLCNFYCIRVSFAKFVDSPYYSESDLCGGAVTVFFSKYLPWKTMQFLQRSTHFSKTCCRPLITSKFHASELPFRGSKSPEIAWGEI